MHKDRIAIAFLDIAEHLVVGAVLLDDVDDVFENTGLAGALRDRPRGLPGARRAGVQLVTTAMAHVGEGRS